MQTALLVERDEKGNIRSARPIAARAFEARLKSEPDLRRTAELISPAMALPVVFRESYDRFGLERRHPDRKAVSACFAYAAGCGQDEHMFRRKKTSLEKEIRAGHDVLITLNTKLAYNGEDFSKVKSADNRRRSFAAWLAQRGRRYITCPAKSVREFIKNVHKLRALGVDTHKKIWVLHQGGVLPFDEFFISPKTRDIRLSALFNALQNGLEGVSVNGTRFVGMPRLIAFKPTKTTLEKAGHGGIKGNVFIPTDENANYISQLIFPKQEDAEKGSDAFKKLFQEIAEAEDGIYVMASPVITIKPDDIQGELKDPQSGRVWKQLRWIINDVVAQTCPVGITKPKSEKNKKSDVASGKNGAVVSIKRSPVPPRETQRPKDGQGLLFPPRYGIV